MPSNRMGDHNRVSANIKPGDEEKLPIWAAEMRVLQAVDRVEEALNVFNKTPGKRDQVRRDDLANLFMSLLAEKYGVAPPYDATEDEINDITEDDPNDQYD